jgi:hypothetical protein
LHQGHLVTVNKQSNNRWFCLVFHTTQTKNTLNKWYSLSLALFSVLNSVLLHRSFFIFFFQFFPQSSSRNDTNDYFVN